MVQNANTSIIFDLVYLFATMIAYHVEITTKVSEYGMTLKSMIKVKYSYNCHTAHNTNSSLVY